MWLMLTMQNLLTSPQKASLANFNPELGTEFSIEFGAVTKRVRWVLIYLFYPLFFYLLHL